MTSTGPGKWDPRKWLACAGIAGVLLLGVAGCASRGADPGASHDIMTESDEPEVRKRARIRMEITNA